MRHIRVHVNAYIQVELRDNIETVTHADKVIGLLKRKMALVNLTSTDQQTPTSSAEFTYLTGEDDSSVWPAGVPSDGAPIEVQHYPFLALMILVYIFVLAGLVFTAICLIFNIFFRNHKYILYCAVAHI